ncbi:hypothetical protein [Hyphobacterium sp.]|uniref:hypothetical protein n=1 Tax=Hyphobacterium sp. TaxID=2004662 RepID=UPI003BA9FB16
MAKADFHKHQRVFVRPVGTWALIEQVKPHWVKGVEEPVRISYDCGLGRDFTADELSEEERQDAETGRWRLMRAKNKWQSLDECAHHPFPGTFPVVVTDEQNWGGWRVPGAEYDRDPQNIEFQARLITAAPTLMKLAERLASEAQKADEMPEEIRSLCEVAKATLKRIQSRPADKPSHNEQAA